MSTKIIKINCRVCNRAFSLLVPTRGLKLWASGQAKIQDALPDLSANERELLISQVCPDCWDKMWGE